MRSKLGWILAIIFGLLLLLAVPALFFFGHGWFGGMMGGYGGVMDGYGRMMGRGFASGFTPFNWVIIISSWLIRAGVFVLLVLAGVWVVTSLTRSGQRPAAPTTPTTPPEPVHTCPNCSRVVQADWKICPYCETRLT